MKRVSKKNGEISAAICQNIGQSKLKSFCVCEERRGVDCKTGKTEGGHRSVETQQNPPNSVLSPVFSHEYKISFLFICVEMAVIFLECRPTL